MTTSTIEFNLYGNDVTVEFDSWPTEPQTMVDPGIRGGIELTALYFSEEGDDWLEHLSDKAVPDIHEKTLIALEPDE